MVIKDVGHIDTQVGGTNGIVEFVRVSTVRIIGQHIVILGIHQIEDIKYLVNLVEIGVNGLCSGYVSCHVKGSVSLFFLFLTASA